MFLKEVQRKDGSRDITVRVRTGDKVVVVHDNMFYQLGGQLDEIVPGYVLNEAARVVWCHISQKWVTT